VVDVMTTPVISVAPDTRVDAAIALLETHRIGRLPVVAAGTLVGILSRSDLLALVSGPPTPTPSRTDAHLVAEMRGRLRGEAWATGTGLHIDAHDGVLWLGGAVENAIQKSAIETMARSIPGCRGVRSHLIDRRTLPSTRC
jgi:hypothetical protein